jgi:hypothetical protein
MTTSVTGAGNTEGVTASLTASNTEGVSEPSVTAAGNAEGMTPSLTASNTKGVSEPSVTGAGNTEGVTHPHFSAYLGLLIICCFTFSFPLQLESGQTVECTVAKYFAERYKMKLQ